MNKNIELWTQVCKTDPTLTKKVSFGARNYTTVCAQSQIKKATSIWGSMGNKWGIRDEHFFPGDKIVFYQAKLFYPGGEIPIHSDCELYLKSGKYNEDWAKKMATDALTKGLSKLGFNSDIFEGKFDDNMYVAQMKAEFNASKPASINPQTNNLPRSAAPQPNKQPPPTYSVAVLPNEQSKRTPEEDKERNTLIAQIQEEATGEGKILTADEKKFMAQITTRSIAALKKGLAHFKEEK